MATNLKNKDRALALGPNDVPAGDIGLDIDDDIGVDDVGGATGQDPLGSKVIVIHPGSQNLRIGLASDALPKSIPMVIARRSNMSEFEEYGGEPKPKRQRTDDGSLLEPEKMFGDDVSNNIYIYKFDLTQKKFATQYNAMCADLKVHMRNNKRRVLPNSKELVVNYNRRAPPEKISEHNDPLRIDWTEIPSNPKQAQEFYTGKEALRIPDQSNPRYKLFWPLQHGWYNEHEYDDKTLLHKDIATILEEAIKNQLNLKRKRDWVQYGCVFIIPDLYEKHYVTQILETIMRDFGFGRICFIQESLAATFGAGYTIACVVDIGAQKTSICCVEEGMCIENSRVNIKYGGADVTETFIKMMLFDHFPYADINLMRRYDFLLAEEIKSKFCTLNEGDISVQLFDFHVRASGQDTRKYTFKTYDEVLLAPQGYFQPSIFDNHLKLRGRRKIIGRSLDLYDSSPNDPVSLAQSDIISRLSPAVAINGNGATNDDGANSHSIATPIRQMPNPFQRLQEADQVLSAVGSPMPDDEGTPMPAVEGNAQGTNGSSGPSVRDDILPIVPLDDAIFTSISHGARGDDRKMRDFLGGIMVIGGGSRIPGFSMFLEERMKQMKSAHAKEVMIGTPPRELDPQVVVWKGGSVFGKLRGTNDSWIGKVEYDRLGARLLAYKCMWAW